MRPTRRGGKGGHTTDSAAVAGKVSPMGLATLLGWLASVSGPVAAQLLARQGVVAGIVAMLRPQHLQALQVGLLPCCKEASRPRLQIPGPGGDQ